MALNPINGILIRRRKFGLGNTQGECPVMAEIGVGIKLESINQVGPRTACNMGSWQKCGRILP
jgi:hypothetical protein